MSDKKNYKYQVDVSTQKGSTTKVETGKIKGFMRKAIAMYMQNTAYYYAKTPDL